MAYLRVTFNGQEIDRRDLGSDGKGLVIGRAAECDLAVRDILLSRRHCRLEPAGREGWKVVDLRSRNGTTLNGEALTAARRLSDGDVLRLGRVKAIFGMGRLADLGLTDLHYLPPRPTDPNESMSGTFTGFQFLEPGESAADENLAHPRPEPKTPEAYQREDVYSLLHSLASSSWDSIYAQARRPVPASAIGVQDEQLARPRLRPRSPIDFSLQVCVATEATFESPLPRRHPRRRMARAAAPWLILLSIVGLKGWMDARGVIAPPAAQARIRSQPWDPNAVVVSQVFTTALPMLW
jgi:pSer/pThr/pTyr-binding forkhead associated (FHA) protein